VYRPISLGSDICFRIWLSCGLKQFWSLRQAVIESRILDIRVGLEAVLGAVIGWRHVSFCPLLVCRKINAAAGRHCELQQQLCGYTRAWKDDDDDGGVVDDDDKCQDITSNGPGPLPYKYFAIPQSQRCYHSTLYGLRCWIRSSVTYNTRGTQVLQKHRKPPKIFGASERYHDTNSTLRTHNFFASP